MRCLCLVSESRPTLKSALFVIQSRTPRRGKTSQPKTCSDTENKIKVGVVIKYVEFNFVFVSNSNETYLSSSRELRVQLIPK